MNSTQCEMAFKFREFMPFKDRFQGRQDKCMTGAQMYTFLTPIWHDKKKTEATLYVTKPKKGRHVHLTNI